MNERLEKEIDRYEEELHGFESSSRYDCICIARHFYSVALEDVRNEIERMLSNIYERQDGFKPKIPEFLVAQKISLDSLLDFIDQLSK